MSLGTRTKDPADVRIYGINWAAFLTERSTTISSSTWSVPGGVTQVSASNTTTATTIKVSGGQDGQQYELTNTVVLANGETIEKSITLQVRNQ